MSAPFHHEPPGDAAERCMNSIRSVVRALRIDSRAIELKIALSLTQLFMLQELDKLRSAITERTRGADRDASELGVGPRQTSRRARTRCTSR